MKISMVIPSYWMRRREEGYKKGDRIYDHPTPINEDGTLLRAIESIKKLNDKNFELIIIAASTADEINEKVEKKVRNMLKDVKLEMNINLFSHSHLKELQAMLPDEYNYIPSLYGYSNIRNLCILLPHIKGSDVSILIDDDEVFENEYFIERIKSSLTMKIEGREIYGLAGYYLQDDGNYFLKETNEFWQVYWNKSVVMNKAFKEIISREPEIKKTYFVFGGNMIIRKELFTKIAFDPFITRGEDIDYLINAMMQDFDFYLDNKLNIKHLPPPKPHPLWKKLREDIIRFVYEREKILHQKDEFIKRRVEIKELKPYPGYFLDNDLEEKIIKTSELLSMKYVLDNKYEDARESLTNIEIMKEVKTKGKDNFMKFIEFQNKWSKLMDFIEDNRDKYKDIF